MQIHSKKKILLIINFFTVSICMQEKNSALNNFVPIFVDQWQDMPSRVKKAVASMFIIRKSKTENLLTRMPLDLFKKLVKDTINAMFEHDPGLMASMLNADKELQQFLKLSWYIHIKYGKKTTKINIEKLRDYQENESLFLAKLQKIYQLFGRQYFVELIQKLSELYYWDKELIQALRYHLATRFISDELQHVNE